MSSQNNIKIPIFYYYVCLLFILIMPLGNISFFEIGFHGTPTNILIITTTVILITNYLLFSSFRRHLHQRFGSFESRNLLVPLLLILCFDILSTSYYGGLNYLADRVGTVLLVIIFLVGIDSREKLKKIPIFWMVASSYLATQNILSQLGVTPVIEGSRISAPRTLYGVKMPFNYAAGFPGAFGWHGMLLVTGLIFSMYYTSGRNKLLGVIVALLCLTSIAIMQSRSTYLAAAVSMAVYLLATLYVRRKIIPFFIILMPVVILFFYYLPEIVFYISYFIDEFINIARGNVYKRFSQFHVAIEAGLTNPLLGKGHNYFFESLASSVIHNTFLYQLSAIGFIGFLIYDYIYLKSFLTAARILLSNKKRSYNDKLILAFFCALIGMCIELSLFKVISGKEQWLIIYFILLYYATDYPTPEKMEEKNKQKY